MGEYRFRMPVGWKLNQRQSSCIHVIGLDGIPWPCRVQIEDGILSIARNRNESGKIYISYPFQKHGELTVSTGTLPEREESYDLITELARGTLNRLRNQISIWQEGGLEISSGLEARVAQATENLSSAILSSDDHLKELMASRALDLAMDGIFDLSRHFGVEIAQFRVSQTEIAPFWLAGPVASKPAVSTSESTVFDLYQSCSAEAKSEHGISDGSWILGPLLDASAGAEICEEALLDDFDTRKRQILQRCRTLLEACPSATGLIHAVCGLNGIGHRQLSFPQQMQTTVEILRMIADSDLDVPVMASFDFPWAERLAWSVGGTHPLQVADSLLRQSVPISCIGLDVNLDYWPSGSVARDPLQWIDLTDVWSQLGLPLIFCFRWPYGGQETANLESSDRSQNTVRQGMSDQQRMRLLDTILPMLIARPIVHGVLFRQQLDQDDLRYPNAGIFGADRQPKQIVNIIGRCRKDVLQRND